MRKNRIVSLLLALVMLIAMLPLSAMPAKAATNVDLTLWVDVDSENWAWSQIEAFKAAHPEWNLNVSIEFCHAGDAGNIVGADPQAAADIFMYANDQLGALANAGAVLPITGSAYNQAVKDNSASTLNTVSYGGKLYGMPYASNTWFMYYNKDIFSEEDVKSLETMLSKGKVSFPLTNSWYLPSFYFANGCTMFGDSGKDAIYGIDFATEKGIAATKRIVELVNHPNFCNDQDGSGNNGLRNGTIGAYFSGAWDYMWLYNALGDKLGAVQLPTVQIDGKTCQLKAFCGCKAMGVNAHTKYPEAALALAAFLTREEAQLQRYYNFSDIPTCVSLANHVDVSRNVSAKAQIDTMANTSTIQPWIPEMASYWNYGYAFGYALSNGSITASNAEEETLEWVREMNFAVAITGQPVDQVKNAGENATFQVSVSTPGSISYRWQYKAPNGSWTNCTGAGAAGTTAEGDYEAVLTVPVTAAVDGYSYRCVFDNHVGSQISSRPVKLSTPKAEGWNKVGNDWVFYRNGEKVTGWLKSGNYWYYLDANGIMQTGWTRVGSNWYYMNKSGVMMTGWVRDGNYWYYMGSGGAMMTGWVKSGSNWYYMNKSGVMMTGWVKVGSYWYYMAPGGAMQTGWVGSGSKWYYMNPSGSMATSSWIKDGGYWYYVDANGVMVTGTQVIGGKTYFFNDKGVWIP